MSLLRLLPGGVAPVERLEAEIVELSSQLTAATARLLGLVGEFDLAEGWREWGMRSTAHWLSWQCGVGLTAGREQVRVARALRSLPLVAAEFAAGRLSYSKVRAVSRVATPATEAMLVEWALHATGAQLDRLFAAQRRVTRTADVRARHDARYLTWRWDDDGSLVGSFRLPPEQAAVLLGALDAAKAELPASPDLPARAASAAEVDPADTATGTPAEPFPDDPARAASAEARTSAGSIGERTPASQGWQFPRDVVDRFVDRYATQDTADRATDTSAEARRDEPGRDASAEAPGGAARSVDALVQVAARYLDTRRETASANQRDRYQLVLHATTGQLTRDHDHEAADGVTTDTGIRLHPETARRLTCDCPTSTLTVDEHGTPLHLGRRTRRIRGRLARALRYRDHGRCQAPGCTATATISHHIRHWANGGPTCLTNLISLCDTHHWLVHDGGWSIAILRPGAWRFYAPDGRRLDTDNAPARASQPLLTDPAVTPDAVTGYWNGEPLQIGYATGVLNRS